MLMSWYYLCKLQSLVSQGSANTGAKSGLTAAPSARADASSGTAGKESLDDRVAVSSKPAAPAGLKVLEPVPRPRQSQNVPVQKPVSQPSYPTLPYPPYPTLQTLPYPYTLPSKPYPTLTPQPYPTPTTLAPLLPTLPDVQPLTDSHTQHTASKINFAFKSLNP